MLGGGCQYWGFWVLKTFVVVVFLLVISGFWPIMDEGREIGGNMHQAIKRPINARRGEGGGEWTGGPLWNPAWGTGNPSSLCRSTTTSSTSRATRATIKALPASLHPPSPLRIIRFRFARLMPITADLSARGNPTILVNLHLSHLPYRQSRRLRTLRFR